MSRRIGQRLIVQLRQVRAELEEAVTGLSDSDLDWAPEPSMKNYRRQLREIGGMNAESILYILEGKLHKYEDCEAMIVGDTLDEIMSVLRDHHDRMIAFLEAADDATLTRTLEIPAEWEHFFKTRQLEVEELIHWIARHEYYHTGQITTYRWIQGHNPYKS